MSFKTPVKWTHRDNGLSTKFRYVPVPRLRQISFSKTSGAQYRDVSRT